MAEQGERDDVFRMTNAGHDFLENTRKGPIWEKTKAAAAHMQGANLRILGDIAEELVRQGIREFGVLL